MVTEIDFKGKKRIAIILDIEDGQNGIIRLKRALDYVIFNIIGKNTKARQKMKDFHLYPILGLLVSLTELNDNER